MSSVELHGVETSDSKEMIDDFIGCLVEYELVWQKGEGFMCDIMYYKAHLCEYKITYPHGRSDYIKSEGIDDTDIILQ